MKKKSSKNVIALLKSSLVTIVTHQTVIQPFIVIGFIQLLILELLYFGPRFPLAAILAPLIKYHYGELVLHYPFHVVILPSLFENLILQILIYIFITSYFICVAIAIINAINNDKKITLGSAMRQVVGQYIYITIAALIIFLSIKGLSKVYSLVLKRAFLIHSETGIFYLLKLVVIKGAPYFNILINVFVMTFYAFLYPSLVIEKKKIHTALIANFKKLFRHFWFVFIVILLPALLYVPVLLLQTNVSKLGAANFPELRILLLILSIIVIIVTDMIIYTALTTYYLLRQEDT